MTNVQEGSHNIDSSADAMLLRAEATRRVSASFPLPLTADLSGEAARELIHELRVHQIELEIQNEELRRTQRMVEKAHTRYFNLFNQAPVGFVSISPNGHIHDVNQAGAELVGLPASAVIGEPFRRFIHHEDEHGFYLLSRQPADVRKIERHECRLVRPDGTKVWVQITVTPTIHPDGDLLDLLALVDISDRKNSEASLRESEARFRRIVDTVSEGICKFDAQANITFLNPQLASMLGYKADDMLGRNSSEFMDVESHKLLLQHLERRRQGIAEQCDLVLRRKDGGSVWVLLSAKPLHDEKGDHRGALVMLTDITERRRNDDRIRQLALAVEQSPDGILISDADHRITYANGAWLQSVGYELNEVLSASPGDFSVGGFAQPVYANLETLLQGGSVWQGEIQRRHRNGSVSTVWMIVAPLVDVQGKITHHVGIQRDITEKKQLDAELNVYRQGLETLVAHRTEELVMARQQADAANLAKSAFLSSMSHEIRTPMSAIIGITDLMRRGNPTREQSDRLTKIEVASQHLMAVINDLLDLSKIEAGRMKLETINFSLHTVLDDVVAMVGNAASTKGLGLAIEGAEVVPRLCGDPRRLRQALLNYASNAVKFTPQGQVTLRVETVTESKESVELRFWVEDTGPGIDAAWQAQLFHDFEQGDASITRMHGGTGLGLAITKRLARLMGGDVGVQSTLGEGSRFWFTARLLKATVDVEKAPAVPVSSVADRMAYRGANILLVEDEEMNRELATIWLNEMGVNVDTASDGVEAVELAKKSNYDLVFMDMRMSKMNGPQATRLIRALPGWKDTPILALTANFLEESATVCQAAGMNEVLGKPVSLELLQAAFSKWLSPRLG